MTRTLQKHHWLHHQKTAALVHRGGGFLMCRTVADFVEKFSPGGLAKCSKNGVLGAEGKERRFPREEVMA